MRFPIQLIYESSDERCGILGGGWRSPQLESAAYYDKDGVLWITPWGEKIKFFPKKEASPKDAIKIDLYEQAKKGRGFFSPYSDWEANTSAPEKLIRQTGDWTFTGKSKYQGWRFVYREGRLQRISAPSGRALEFRYAKNKLSKILQSGQAFVELTYTDNLADKIVINGTVHVLVYKNANGTILPKTIGGKTFSVMRPRLMSVRTGDLNPSEFTYDRMGFLTRISQGNFVDVLTVQHQTEEQRQAELQANKDRKIKYSGPINGRLLSDVQFAYSYASPEAGNVTLRNQSNQTANYHFDEKTGIFRISEFSGKSYTIYYFMRYDVAYLGKVRKIVDGRGRDVVSYRYDKMSGNVVRIRDMAGNDVNFAYYPDGKLKQISRRGADQNDPEPVTGFVYDRENNPSEISRLNAKGQAVVTTKIQYNQNRQPMQISNGQTETNTTYNRFGYPIGVRDVFGRSRSMTWDEFNRLVDTTDSYGVTTHCRYTPAGLISRIERKDGKTSLTSLAVSYDGNGRPVSYTDQSGRVKKFERDAFGRVVKELFPDDTSVEYTYNKVGQLHKVLDQNKHTITFDWNKFGLDAKRTAANQLTDYVHDKYGMLTRTDSRWKGKTDRSIKYEYDKLDRLIKVSYGNGEDETFRYNSWGKLIAATLGKKEAKFKYDYFGRLVARMDGEVLTQYLYNPWGQQTGRRVVRGSLTLDEFRAYDRYGRLTRIESGNKVVEYKYNKDSQVAEQVIDGVSVAFEYTKYGQLKKKTLGAR